MITCDTKELDCTPSTEIIFHEKKHSILVKVSSNILSLIPLNRSLQINTSIDLPPEIHLSAVEDQRAKTLHSCFHLNISFDLASIALISQNNLYVF